jgi:hypothetical protein
VGWWWTDCLGGTSLPLGAEEELHVGRAVREFACSSARQTSDERVGGQGCIVFSRRVYGAFVSINVLRMWARETGSSEVCVCSCCLEKRLAETIGRMSPDRKMRCTVC